MKVWTNTSFDGHYPVGTAAVVVADTATQAAELLNDELQRHGLSRSAIPRQFVRIPTSKPFSVVLCDGDY
jgi:hypothetical protein